MKNIYYTVILTISLITSFFPKLIYAQQDRDGSSMERAINIGVKSTAFFYIDTKDTSLWGSAYPPYYLDKGSDVYYTFTLETPMIVLIHTLGSELRGTEIYLYDSSGDCNGKKRLMTKDEYMDYVLETSEDQYTLDIIHDDYFLKDCSVTILDSGTYCVAVHGIKRGNLNWMNGPITTTIIGELMGKYIPMPFPVQPDLPITDLPPDSSPSKDFPSIEPLVVSSDQNYIHTRTMTNDTGTTYLDAIQYFDGLGRPMQTVQKGVTPAQADLVTYQEYDAFGREEKTWLPAVAASNNGAFVPLASFKDKAMTTYNSTAYHPAADSVAYSMPVYEASPLNRVLEQYGPGEAWKTGKKAVRAGYLTNIAKTGTAWADADSLVCALYKTTDDKKSISLSRTGNYNANELYVTRMKDEDDNTSYEFKDKQGLVVLVRQINDGKRYDTNYIYDSYGNQRAVLPPEASDRLLSSSNWTDADTNLKLYAYLYKYDNRNRCIYKKIPGCEPVYYVYDKADHLIFTQDGEQRGKTLQEWTFSIPDAFGRVVLTGTCTDTISVSNKVVKGVYASTGGYKRYTIQVDGVAKTFTDTPSILSVNYYDNYDFRGMAEIPDNTNTQYNAETDYNTRYTGGYKGMLTGTLTAQMNTDGTVSSTYLYSVLYYDSRGRVIQTKSNNHLGGIEEEYIAYNFTGQPTKRKHIHQATGKTAQTEEYAYTYDHAGRLLTTTHRLTDGSTVKPQVTLAENTYDELGRLKTNTKGGVESTQATYDYNVRSWTKSITGTLFTENLQYGYTGNISQMQWIVDNQSRKYDFTYDNLSRLKAAAYTGIGSEQYGTAYSYGKHGNMLTLQRYGKKDVGTGSSSYGLVDNLTLNYTGNQLKNVSDAGVNVSINTSMDFKDYSTLDVEYMYNANGSMTKDFNKGISQIQYNSLNLPRIVDVKNQNAEGRNEYTYSASGVKLKAVQRLNSGYSSNPLIGSTINTAALDITKTTDYAGNIIYEDGTLKRILVDGGYYEGGTYYYYLTDHLGNNRIVANASGTVVQKTHYYPFGMPFADATGQDAQPYKYNNKELDTRDGLNWYDYSARYLSLDIPVLPMVDPKAESYPWNSPYMYAGNNPILNFDPDGEDYWSTNDPELIKQFFNSMGRGAKYYDFSGWDHATDAEFVGNGTYNDGTGKFHTSYASYKNGIATVVGVSFDANFKPVSLTGQGYAGAFVYGYGSRGGGLYQAGYNAAQFGELSAFVAEFMSPFDPNSYFDGINNWIVDASGRLTGVNNVQEAKKGGGGNALAKIFIKGFGMVNKEIFHKVIKKSILNATGKGSFSKVIGDNPDITVVNGKIVLQGTKPGFKGKTFNTELNANDFLQ